MTMQNHDNIEETPVPPSGPTTDTTSTQARKQKPGASWKASERHVLPENRLWIVFPGLCLCVFLAALGMIIIKDSLLTK